MARDIVHRMNRPNSAGGTRARPMIIFRSLPMGLSFLPALVGALLAGAQDLAAAGAGA